MVIFIRVSALLTRGQDHRHIRTAPFARRFAVLCRSLLLTETHCSAQFFCTAVAPHVFFTDVAVATKIGVEISQVSLFPHLFRFVPAQHSVPDVIRGSDSANLPRPISSQAT